MNGELNLTSYYLEYLKPIYNDEKNNELGLEALYQMIFWQMLDSDYKNSIDISKGALKKLPYEEKMCVQQNLAMMYIECCDQKNAEKEITNYKKDFSFDKDIINKKFTKMQRVKK